MLQEATNAVLSLTKEGFPLWLVVLLLLTFTTSRVVQSYLATYTNFATPLELRRQHRLKQITEQSGTESVAEMKDLLEEERQRLIFLDITGINASLKRRAQLRSLYEAAHGRYEWKDIRMAEPFLKQDVTGRLVQGVKPVFVVFMYAYFTLGVVTLGAAYRYAAPLLLSSRDASGSSATVLLAAALIVFGILLLMAGSAFRQGLPVLRALQLQKWIP